MLFFLPACFTVGFLHCRFWKNREEGKAGNEGMRKRGKGGGKGGGGRGNGWKGDGWKPDG